MVENKEPRLLPLLRDDGRSSTPLLVILYCPENRIVLNIRSVTIYH